MISLGLIAKVLPQLKAKRMVTNKQTKTNSEMVKGSVVFRV